MIHYVAQQFGPGKNIEPKNFLIFMINFLPYLNSKKKYFTKHKLKTYWIGHQIFLKNKKLKKENYLFFCQVQGN